MASRLSLRGGRGKKSGRGGGSRKSFLVATWDQSNLYYLLVTNRRQQLTAVDWGELTSGDVQPPIKQLVEHVQAAGHAVNQLALLMPRTQLEMITVAVPAADDDELTALVQAEVEGQVGDGEQTLVTDYCRLGKLPAATSLGSEEPSELAVSAVAFTTDASNVEAWRKLVVASQWQLIGITSRQLAPLESLRRQQVFRGRASILIVVYAGEVELSFFRGEQLTFLRTFRTSSGSTNSLAEQIQLEVQRSLSTMDFAQDSEPPELLLLSREGHSQVSNRSAVADADDDPQALDDDDWRDLYQALDARRVRLEIPLEPGIEMAGKAAGGPDPALVGAALDLAEHQLTVDLLNPKQPAKPPNVVLRWSLIGGLAVAALITVAFLMWADVRALQTQLAEGQEELKSAKEVANKLQEKADETRYVQNWLGDQVDWLAKLKRLSDQFPSGQGANVRRLTAAATGEAGVFDISLQVSDPSRVAELENRLREAGFSVTSQQISEQGGNAEYPWQLEARIGFPLTPLDEREEAFVAAASPLVSSDAGAEASSEAETSPAETPAAETPAGTAEDDGNLSPADGELPLDAGNLPAGDEPGEVPEAESRAVEDAGELEGRS
ncbi:hypothetical protein SH139x_001576 [Planctomycetaceae bacterium SH139]